MNIYDKLYAVDGIDYGNTKTIKDSGTEREKNLLREINKVISDNNISGTMSVLEIGASLGYNHQCHPNYLGIEYLSVAVDVAKTRFGLSLNVTQGDATSLDLKSGSIDFVFTFATLEHIPEIGNALAEIGRVLRKGGFAYLAPAWNCRIWTVEKLEQIPDRELTFGKLMQKKLIPIRENLIYRFLKALPFRVLAELKVALGGSYKLRYLELPVDYAMIERYGHVSDDDAFVSIDSHSVMCWYRARGFRICSHPTLVKRLLCRGEAILIQKS